ncbi:exported hypothetical protein [Candidatus Sulfotelmatomonas gaucii]|uniref:Uncharacterized protein n=1 Tax=Candidatus Sulfuritelmatomonas gaucii TaxID=2043161 RepID=A0A2N9M090_9BACT|nr:exported hypothetical protein [Candidatus Sulfotelmatomonas gaucii]
MFKPTESFCHSTFLAAVILAASPILHAGAHKPVSDQIASDTGPDAAASIDSAQLAIIDIGDMVALSGRYETAIKIYAKSPRKTVEIWNKMGMSYEMMFNTSEAIRCYIESLKLNPNDPSVLNNLATLYESKKEYGAADHYFERALSVDPQFAAIYKNLGTSLIAQHRYAEGQKAYEQALALDPSVFDVHGNPTLGSSGSTHERGAINYFMALACVRTGQIDRALDYLRMSLNQGFVDPTQVAADGGFAALSADPGFKKLLAEESGQ